jgi:hypothetical protein
VHADEVFQFLEPAHRVAFGTWLPSWEWQQGLRNWAVPGLLGGLLKLVSATGARDPWAHAAAIWLACAALQAWGTLGLFRLVEDRDGERAAALAAWAHATWGGWLVYAARPIGDALAVAPLLWALVYAQRARRGNRPTDGALAGLLLGTCFVVRYPSAVFGAPVLGSLLLARRWRALAAAVAGGLLVVAGLAALDFATWGKPFHSVIEYLRFNLISGSAGARFGVKPWWWYAPIAAGMAPVALAWHFGRGLARRDLVVASLAIYLGAIEALGHKEARFLVPLLPLGIAIAAKPLALDFERWIARRPRVLLGLWALLSLLSATVQRPFGFNDSTLDATTAVGRSPDLTGLLVLATTLSSTGGRFFLARDEVPMRIAYGATEAEVASALSDPVFSHALIGPSTSLEARLKAAEFARWRSFPPFSVWRRAPSTPSR